MNDAAIHIRPAAEADVDAVFHIRTSVKENHLSLEQMAAMGITPDAIREAIAAEPCVWLAEAGGKAVGFAMLTWRKAAFLPPLFCRNGRGAGLAEGLWPRLRPAFFAST